MEFSDVGRSRHRVGEVLYGVVGFLSTSNFGFGEIVLGCISVQWLMGLSQCTGVGCVRVMLGR